MVRREEKKEINLDQVVTYLTNAFGRASRYLGFRNQLGTDLYQYQVEFMYMIDDIKRGPNYIVPKRIAEANQLIDNITQKMEG